MKTIQQIIEIVGEGNFPVETFIGPDSQGICAAGGGDILLETPLVHPGQLHPGQLTLNEFNRNFINLAVHCINHYPLLIGGAAENVVEHLETV